MLKELARSMHFKKITFWQFGFVVVVLRMRRNEHPHVQETCDSIFGGLQKRENNLLSKAPEGSQEEEGFRTRSPFYVPLLLNPTGQLSWGHLMSPSSSAHPPSHPNLSFCTCFLCSQTAPLSACTPKARV